MTTTTEQRMHECIHPWCDKSASFDDDYCHGEVLAVPGTVDVPGRTDDHLEVPYVSVAIVCDLSDDAHELDTHVAIAIGAHAVVRMTAVEARLLANAVGRAATEVELTEAAQPGA